MAHQPLISIVSVAYVFCSALYFSNLFFKGQQLSRAATYLTIITLLTHTIALCIRWIETYRMGLGHLHIVTLYESLIFIAWSIVVSYIIIEFKFKSKAIGGFIIPVAAILMIYASMFPNVNSSIAPVPEVLQGNFYNYHVIPCFFAYAAFTVSFGASIVFLIKNKSETRSGSSDSFWNLFPTLNTLDNIIYKSIAVGFIFFTIQMVAGMFRTKIIWDSYWEWDPTQVFGLMTWLIYLTILHGRYRRWWVGNKTALLSIMGFLSSAIGFAAATGRMLTTGHYPIL